MARRLSLLLLLAAACSGAPNDPALSGRGPVDPESAPHAEQSSSPRSASSGGLKAALNAKLAGSAMPVAGKSSPLPAPSALPPPPSPLALAAAKIGEATLASSQAYAIARSLTDEVGHRLAGSPGNKAAVAWAERALTANGFQNVRVEQAKATRWERGPASAAIVAPARHTLVALALGGSVATPKGGIEADVIEADSLASLEKLDKAAVKGKIVFLSTPMERTRDGSGYGRAAGIRSQGPSAAAKLGAVALVIRSVGTDVNRLPHTGGLRYEDGVPKIPAAALSVPDAELLRRLVAAGKPVRLKLELAAKDAGEAPAPNVVGEIVGRSAPDEIVLIGAHLDSWDVGTGALDDASGCAAVIEAGRQIGKLAERPRRTVRVVLFNNEENGLGGARAYAATHAAALEKHIVAIEADLGAGRVWGLRYLGADAARPRFLAIAEPVSRALGAEIVPEPAHGGADLIPLRMAGVPVLDLAQDASLYFDYHHTENDTFDKIRKEDLDQVAAAYAMMAYSVAEMDGDLGRIPEDKRRWR